MNLDKLTLMTFSLDFDVFMKGMTVRDILAAAESAGIRRIDVMILSGDRLQEYTDAIAESGIKPYCYIGTISFFSKSDAEIRQALQAQLETAAHLGAKLYMIVPIDSRNDQSICEEMGKTQVQERLKLYFSAAVSLAEGTGVQVCFETTPQDYSCLSGTEDCRWILEQVPGLGLVYDTANMLPHGDDPLRYYAELKSYIVHVHAKDVCLIDPEGNNVPAYAERSHDGKIMKCCISGQGVIPLKEILVQMERDGYAGLYALEYSRPDHYPANLEQHIHRLRQHMPFWNALNA